MRTGTTAVQKELFFNFRRLRNKIYRVDDPVRRDKTITLAVLGQDLGISKERVR